MSFPAPGDDLRDIALDLNQLIKNPEATFLMRIDENAIPYEGVFPGDLLIVDRSLEVVPGELVVAVVDGALSLRRMTSQDGALRLQKLDWQSEESVEFEVWGVVTTVIHSFKSRSPLLS